MTESWLRRARKRSNGERVSGGSSDTVGESGARVGEGGSESESEGEGDASASVSRGFLGFRDVRRFTGGGGDGDGDGDGDRDRDGDSDEFVVLDDQRAVAAEASAGLDHGPDHRLGKTQRRQHSGGIRREIIGLVEVREGRVQLGLGRRSGIVVEETQDEVLVVQINVTAVVALWSCMLLLFCPRGGGALGVDDAATVVRVLSGHGCAGGGRGGECGQGHGVVFGNWCQGSFLVG